jgi:hypothetical protein
MTEAPPLKAWIVTLNFGEGGPLHTNIWLAPDAPNAVALCTWDFMTKVRPETPLLCCMAGEIGADQLRHLLRTVEGKLPAGGNAEIVSLVPRDLAAENEENVARAAMQRPLDAADASTFIGPNVDRLWAQSLRDTLQSQRGNLYPEPFGPPMPPGAA